MNPMLILNRDFQSPADGWYHIATLGEIPHGESGLVQVMDQAALTSIVNRFHTDATAAGERFAGLLVDFDHFSLDTQKPSEAAGWIMDLQNRADGLWAQIRWSDSGEAAVKGGRYRFLSPVWNRADCETISGNRVRPMRIANAAVTNDPNFKGLYPLSNRRNLKNSAIDNNPSNQPRGIMDYKAKLIAMLGLPADATDEAIQSAIAERAAVANQNKEDGKDKEKDEVINRLKNRIRELEQAALSAKVESALTEHSAVIVNREDVKAALTSNYDATVKVLAGLKKPAGHMPNRRDGKLPESDGDTGNPADQARAAKIRNRAKEIQQTNRGMGFTAAFALAQSEIQ